MVRSTLLVREIVTGADDADAAAAAVASFREVDLVIRMSLANNACFCRLSSSVLEIPSSTELMW